MLKYWHVSFWIFFSYIHTHTHTHHSCLLLRFQDLYLSREPRSGVRTVAAATDSWPSHRAEILRPSLEPRQPAVCLGSPTPLSEPWGAAHALLLHEGCAGLGELGVSPASGQGCRFCNSSEQSCGGCRDPHTWLLQIHSGLAGWGLPSWVWLTPGSLLCWDWGLMSIILQEAQTLGKNVPGHQPAGLGLGVRREG